MQDSAVLNTNSLPEFFKERVDLAISHLNVKVSPDAEFYLVNLLTHFSQTEKLFELNEKGEIVDKALAIMFFESMEASREQRVAILKKMGDVSLYISGFFSDSLFRKLVNLDYYMQMGHSAYSSLSQIGPVKSLYDELAYNFANLVDVISDVADSTSLKTDQSILKLYERWLATGSQRARDLLAGEGIIPLESAKTKYAQ